MIQNRVNRFLDTFLPGVRVTHFNTIPTYDYMSTILLSPRTHAVSTGLYKTNITNKHILHVLHMYLHGR